MFIRLTGDRLCDGYADCPDQEDEMGCGCGDQFRCSSLQPDRDSSFQCVAMEKVCDGVDDCRVYGAYGDEEDCLVLTAREGFTTLANTDTKGFLHARVQGDMIFFTKY